MRKQYYFRPSPTGLLAWDVDRLVELSRKFSVRAVPLEEIQELDVALFGADEAPTWRSFAAHCRLVQEAELRYPIIRAANGAVMDGMHRVSKALIEGRDTIEPCSSIRIRNPIMSGACRTSFRTTGRPTSAEMQLVFAAAITIAGERTNRIETVEVRPGRPRR